jgi:hypothetical protein
MLLDLLLDYDEVFKLVSAIGTDTAFSTEENIIFQVRCVMN